jgi:hypothetical protein
MRWHRHRQPVKWHGGRVWQRARVGDSFPRGWANAGPQQQARREIRVVAKLGRRQGSGPKRFWNKETLF